VVDESQLIGLSVVVSTLVSILNASILRLLPA